MKFRLVQVTLQTAQMKFHMDSRYRFVNKMAFRHDLVIDREHNIFWLTVIVVLTNIAWKNRGQRCILMHLPEELIPNCIAEANISFVLDMTDVLERSLMIIMFKSIMTLAVLIFNET